MSTEVMYTLEKDKQDIQKQLGCMNGIFQLFDRRYLLGQRRNHHQKPLQGVCVDHGPNTVINEKHRESVESSRNSFSSTCSSLDCCKRVQPGPSSFCPSIVSEPASPTLNNKHILCVAPVDNIRDVVKDSMTRKPRAVPVKPVAKAGQKGPTMTHVDSPRLLQPPPKPVPYERSDQNLVKHKETSVPVSMGVKDVNETSRFSYDDRVSPYKLQSYANIKDHPRLSLDSQKSSIKHSANVTREPGSNKPLPSSVVARLMGLDVINCEALKIKPCLDDKTIIVSNALTTWQREVEKRVNVKVKQRSDHACQSVYDHIEQRLTEVGFRTSGKDLRALKHTLEAMQKTKMKLDNTQPHKSAIKQANLTSDSIVITTLQKVKKVNRGIGHGRNLTPAGTKATGGTKQQVSSSHTTDCLTGVSPKHQRSKIRKQSNGHLIVSSSKTRDRSFRDARHIRNLSEESDASFASQNEPDVDSKDRTRETKNKFAERMMGYKPMAEQPSPVSVLDAFYTEDAPSPIKKKSHAFKDDEDSCFDEQEWTQVDDLISSTEKNDNPHEDHIYIKEILSASGLLKNLDFATTIVHLHPTCSLINPELFNILEKTKECTSKSEKIKRKLIFDIVNNILVRKLSRTSNRKGKILDAKKLLEELCIEINDLNTNKKSEDWDDYCNEVPALVLDIERLIFKDLITEIKNVAVSGP
ncbi:putative protein LONGIFOLIA [Helianthus anomalus]